MDKSIHNRKLMFKIKLQNGCSWCKGSRTAFFLSSRLKNDLKITPTSFFPFLEYSWLHINYLSLTVARLFFMKIGLRV